MGGDSPTGNYFSHLNHTVRSNLPQIFKGSYIRDLANQSFGVPIHKEERLVTVRRFACLWCAPERTDQVKLTVSPTVNCDPVRDKLKISVDLGDLSSCLKSLKLDLVQTVALNSWREGKDKVSIHHVAHSKLVKELVIDGATLSHDLSLAECFST